MKEISTGRQSTVAKCGRSRALIAQFHKRHEVSRRELPFRVRHAYWAMYPKYTSPPHTADSTFPFLLRCDPRCLSNVDRVLRHQQPA